MSTKTLRKRIALVAVAALGAGVLSVAPANAAAGDNITAGDISITSVAGTGNANIGICTVSASEGATITQSASLVFSTGGTNGTGYLTIESGPASWVSVAGATVNANASKASFAALNADATLKASALGTVRVTAYNGADVAVEAYSLTVVASCAGDALSVAKSFVQGTVSGGTAVSNIDVANTLDVSEADAYISVALNDAYGNDLTTQGALVVTATNGAFIGWNAKGTTSTAVAATVAATGYVRVSAPTTGAPVSTTVTITFNGAPVATKAVKIRGKATSLAVSDATIGAAGTTAGTPGTPSGDAGVGEFSYQFKDSAGNVVTNVSAAGTQFVAATSATGLDAQVTAATGVTGPSTTSGLTAYGTGQFTCPAGKSGSTTLVIAGKNSSLDVLLSSPITLTCGGTLDTWTVALDKASYAPGDIATLTVTAKDDNGKSVADNTTLVGATANSSPGGGASWVSAPLDANTFTSGVKKYTMIIGNIEGSYNGTIKLAGSTDASAKTFAYTVKNPNVGVSNADVLKAIVSLIASINKQIAALQKALLKKK